MSFRPYNHGMNPHEDIQPIPIRISSNSASVANKNPAIDLGARQIKRGMISH